MEDEISCSSIAILSERTLYKVIFTLTTRPMGISSSVSTLIGVAIPTLAYGVTAAVLALSMPEAWMCAADCSLFAYVQTA